MDFMTIKKFAFAVVGVVLISSCAKKGLDLEIYKTSSDAQNVFNAAIAQRMNALYELDQLKKSRESDERILAEKSLIKASVPSQVDNWECSGSAIKLSDMHEQYIERKKTDSPSYQDYLDRTSPVSIHCVVYGARNEHPLVRPGQPEKSLERDNKADAVIYDLTLPRKYLDNEGLPNLYPEDTIVFSGRVVKAEQKWGGTYSMEVDVDSISFKLKK